MNTQINRTIQKTWQYWYVDGLVELIGGVFVLVLALFQWIIAMAEDGPLAAIIMAIGQPLIIIGGGWLAGKVVRQFKERLTYPRTGYVSYPKPKKRHRVLSMVLAMVISIGLVVSLGYLTPRFGDHITAAFMSVFMSLFLAYLAWHFDLKRFYLTAGLVLATGLATAALRVPQEYGIVFVIAVFGLTSLVSGALVLRRYLNTTSPVDA